MSFQKNSASHRELARKGGLASAAAATKRRLARWEKLGVDPVIGQQIYEAGYQCRVAQERRAKAKAATS